jgi:two-component system, cell cycle sensor histidine kinase and response regulator CckA
MSEDMPLPEPTRPTDVARMTITQLVPGPEMPIREIFRRICEVGAETLRLERGSVWLYTDDRRALRCACLHERTKNEQTSGILLWRSDFPKYFDALENRKTLPAEQAQTDERTSELRNGYLVSLGITSMLDAPILIGGVVCGVICYEHIGPPREWTTEERDFAGSIADILALKMRTNELNDAERKLSSQAARLATLEKAEALGQMAAGVAHDFNNLLTVICGNAGLLSASTDLPEEVRTRIAEIEDAGRRGTAMVRDLLQFARRQGNPPKALDVAATIREFLPVLQTSVGARHPIAFDRGTDLGPVLIDANHLSRILLNLCVNARDAMPGGGTISLALSVAQAESEPGEGASRYLSVEVADTGMGIDPATQKRVFEPYFTTKADGTGLGLALVKKFTEEAGGFVRLQTAAGEGTRVRLYFPRLSSQYP